MIHAEYHYNVLVEQKMLMLSVNDEKREAVNDVSFWRALAWKQKFSFRIS